MPKLAEEADADANWLPLGEASDKDPIARSERLIRVGQSMRAAGVLGSSQSLYLIAHEIMLIVDYRMDTPGAHPRFEAVSEKMHAIAGDHGFWPRCEGPEGYERLRGEYERLVTEIMVATFVEYGRPTFAGCIDSSETNRPTLRRWQGTIYEPRESRN